jgi:transposase-like protein
MIREREAASDTNDPGKLNEPTAPSGRIVSGEELIAGHKEDGRTVYRRAAKAILVAAAMAPGASVAKIAREHGLNANQLHAWILAARKRTGKASSLSAKVGAAMEAAALKRAAPRPTKRAVTLLPITLTDTPAATTITIDIHGARISIHGTLDPVTLTVVLDCLRQSQVSQPQQPRHP